MEEEEALHERNVLAALYCPALDALITSAEEGSIRIHWLNMRWGRGHALACPQHWQLLNPASSLALQLPLAWASFTGLFFTAEGVHWAGHKPVDQHRHF